MAALDRYSLATSARGRRALETWWFLRLTGFVLRLSVVATEVATGVPSACSEVPALGQIANDCDLLSSTWIVLLCLLK